jgi:drug/metabolite transporter (DMT)-like permease
MQEDNLKHYIHLHFIVFIWGFTAILGKLISIEAVPLVWWRMGIASVCIWLYCKWKKYDLVISKKMVFTLFGVGIIIALHWFTFFYSIKVSNVSIAVVCLSTGAFFSSILEPIIKKTKFKISNLLLGVFAIIGLCFIVYDTESGSLNFSLDNYYLGITTGLISAFLSALFAVFNSTLTNKNHAPVISFYELLGGFLCFSIFMFFDNGYAQEAVLISSKDLFWLCLLATICTAYAFINSVKIMKHISAFTMMLTINLEPVYGVILALLFFTNSEKMGFYFYLGALIILSAVILNALLEKRKKLAHP